MGTTLQTCKLANLQTEDLELGWCLIAAINFILADEPLNTPNQLASHCQVAIWFQFFLSNLNFVLTF